MIGFGASTGTTGDVKSRSRRSLWTIVWERFWSSLGVKSKSSSTEIIFSSLYVIHLYLSSSSYFFLANSSLCISCSLFLLSASALIYSSTCFFLSSIYLMYLSGCTCPAPTYFCSIFFFSSTYFYSFSFSILIRLSNSSLAFISFSLIFWVYPNSTSFLIFSSLSYLSASSHQKAVFNI